MQMSMKDTDDMQILRSNLTESVCKVKYLDNFTLEYLTNIVIVGAVRIPVKNAQKAFHTEAHCHRRRSATPSRQAKSDDEVCLRTNFFQLYLRKYPCLIQMQIWSQMMSQKESFGKSDS